MYSQPIEIAGAGPAGLAAAITLARAGRSVVVHEAYHEVGHRFGRDLQGLENWSSPQDVLTELYELGITTDFDHLACRQGSAFDSRDRRYPLHSEQPFFYMVVRGPGEGSLDSALLAQAHTLGIQVRFNSRVRQLAGPAIYARGPQVTDAVSVGYHFDTTMEDGFWVVCDDSLAPDGYAYLLTMAGRGTVKSCMYSDLGRQRLYVQRTVERFSRLVGLQMYNPRPHGGVGAFRSAVSTTVDHMPIAGEQAGFQDALWGFGMRMAIRSGVLAAQALLDDSAYEKKCRITLESTLNSARVNRAFYAHLGNRGYPWLLHHFANSSDTRQLLRSFYGPSRLKQFLAPLAERLI